MIMSVRKTDSGICPLTDKIAWKDTDNSSGRNGSVAKQLDVDAA
jgi:hypothetical protein